MMKDSRTRSGSIDYHHPGHFWFGIAAVTIGVALHLPMYVESAGMHYHMAGMPMDLSMKIGMGLIIVGLIASFYGLLPRGAELRQTGGRQVRIRAMDDAPITKAHVTLLLIMALAVTIDVMKPVTLGFVVPGMAKEYGLKHPVLNPGGTVPVSLLPFFGITGTVIGSFIWGWLSDRIGRRAAILLAAVSFIGTSICGAMPDYRWNFVMCFIMGLGVGGMLPIVFALLAEIIPARHRGWLTVLIGGDVAGAYILTSWLASTVGASNAFGWRILWLLGLPTGLVLVLLNRWIPESPRFLLQRGRDDEARDVMRRYGATIVDDEESELAVVESSVKSSWRQLVGRHFAGLTAVVAVFGIGVGLVTFGFQLWIPSNLRAMGFDEVSADRILRDSALLGFPATFLIAWMYGFWSSKNTLIVLGLATAASLMGFIVLGNNLAGNRALLYALLVVPITGISSIQAVLVAYSSEVYPTRVRGRATGLGAGATKLGGVLIITLVVFAIAPPKIVATSLIGAVPMALGALAVMIWGVETRKRRLEEITAEELTLGTNQGDRPIIVTESLRRSDGTYHVAGRAPRHSGADGIQSGDDEAAQ
ncbi:MAG TPA: MFS transporter [Gemmatimonadaceae bacterium]|nr:MFS transporter [Gemmatimonadaceae bacterium]